MAFRSGEAVLVKADVVFDLGTVTAGSELPLLETGELTGVIMFVPIVLLDRVEVDGVALPID